MNPENKEYFSRPTKINSNAPVSSYGAVQEDPTLSHQVAIVHDYLQQSGGAERVVESIHRLYPNSPIFTSVFDKNATLSYFRDKDVRTSFLQSLPFRINALHKFALPLYPLAFEQFDLAKFDLVISSSSSFAKGVITYPDCCHICYCHTPARFAWRHHEYLATGGATRFLAPMLAGMLSRLRNWDVNSTNRVDYFIANSQNTARRIEKYYRRSSTVIYPPVETGRFTPAPITDVGLHLLVVSRLIGYKRVDLAVEACTKYGFPLRVIGDGPEFKRLRQIAGPNVEFLGRLSDEKTAREMATCRALIFPGEEDFGIVPLEVMASGRPVIAYAAGGALETVIDGVTGVHFSTQNVDSLATAIHAAYEIDFDPETLIRHARGFDTAVFHRRLSCFIENVLEERCERRHSDNGILHR